MGLDEDFSDRREYEAQWLLGRIRDQTQRSGMLIRGTHGLADSMLALMDDWW